LRAQSRDPSVVRSRLALAIALAIASAHSTARAAPGAVDTSWTSVRGDPLATGSVGLHTRSGSPPSAGWQFQAGSHVWGYQPGMSVWSSASLGVVRGEALLFAGSYDGNVYVLDAKTGAKRWRFTTGGGVYSTPALLAGEPPLLFVASSDRLVYALEADTGRRVWVHAIKTWRTTIGGARLSSPAIGRAQGQVAVFVGHWVWDKSLGGHLQQGGLTALEARSGRRLYTAPLGDNQVSSPVYASPGGAGRVFVASENGNLYALEADTGRVLFAFTDKDSIKGHPAVLDETARGGGARVFYGSKSGYVRALDARSGRELWRFKTGHWVDGGPAVLRLDGRAVVFVGSYDTKLYALDAATGAPLWAYATGGGVYSSPALVSLDGIAHVLFTAWDHNLYALSAADGTLLFRTFLGRPIWGSISLGDSLWSSPIAGEIDGRAVAFIGTYAGPLHAILLDDASRRGLSGAGSNLDFWVTLPLVLLATTALALFFTIRRRRQAAAS
jgi:outer membrane protein assembly factor BamB